MSVKRLVSLNTVSLSTDPANPKLGDIYLNSSSNNLRVYTLAGWVEVGAGGGAAVHIGTTPPQTASEGDLWFNNVDPHFYTYDGSFWVEVSLGPVGPAGAGLPIGGLVGQIPVKSSTNDYETEWQTPYSSNSFASDFLNRTTDSLSEGSTNKYFTEQRALNAVTGYVDSAVNGLSNQSATTYALQSDVGNPDGIATLDSNGYIPISQLGNIIDGAPAVLDTLSEIATAISNDPNFSSDIYGAVHDTEIDIIMGVM